MTSSAAEAAAPATLLALEAATAVRLPDADAEAGQVGVDDGRVLRPGEVVALAILAVHRPQAVELLGGLDALGHDGEVQRLTDLDDRFG
jgi:hypothetical protein